jgi:hypothetical protein
MNDQFNMFFHGKGLTPLEQACMRSFVDHGHRLNVYAYQSISVPRGVQVLDANAILPRGDLFLFHNSPSAFSNIFRYKLLLENGGWWVDTDVLCLTDSIPGCDYAWADQDPEQINGAILKLPPGDSLCAELLHASRERAKALSAWGQLGPGLLTEVLPRNPPRGHFGSRVDFYPIHWVEAHMSWMEGEAEFVESRVSNSAFVHLWNSVLVKMKIDLNRRPPEGSYLEKVIPADLLVAMKHEESMADVHAGIRFILDYKPTYKQLYEKRLGLSWSRIYPVSG